MNTKAAYIGIGDMGYPMAGHLATNGYDVSVFDIDRSRVDAWSKEYEGHGRTSATDAAAGADFVFSSVSTEGQVLASTTEEDGAFHSMAPGGVYVDHSTTSAVLARDRAAAALENSLTYLDAPVAGSPAEAARDGTLIIMVGGDKDSFDRLLPALECYGKEVEYLGPSGAGQLAKMVSQIAIAGIVESLAEALHFAQRSGLDGKQVVKLLSRGPATSWWMVNRAGPMLEDRHDVGGPIRNMLKDYAMCLDEAERVGARLPVVELVHRFCEEMTAQGDSERDFTGLIKFLNDTVQN
jgi:3-hydroxyisobutyrate dehydrogenase